MTSVGSPRDAATETPLTNFSSVSSREWLWLGAILAVAFALRLFKLDAALWYDEIDTLVHYARLPTVELLTTYPSLNHHVLFTLEAKAAIALFGESAWALRFPAFVFGVASIWGLWLVARQAVSPWETRLSVLLLAVSYHHVWFSQNARGYTGLLFFGLIATYFLIRATGGATWKTWTAYGIVSALAIYTHLSAVLFVASHFIVCLGIAVHGRFVVERGGGRNPGLVLPLYGFALAGLLALLLYAPLITQLIDTFTQVAAQPSPEIAASIAEWKSPLWMVSEIARSLGPVLGLALPIVLVVVVVGMASLSKSAPILPAIFVVHVALTLAILVVGNMRVWPRHFFIDIGFICIFLVHGTFVLSRVTADFLGRHFNKSIDARVFAIAGTALGICASLVLLPRNYLYPKQDFLGARNFVETNRTAASAVATLGLAAMPFADYYAPHWKQVDSLEEIQGLRQSHGQVWLVYAFPGVTERRYKEIVDYLSIKFERVKRFQGTLGGGDVLVFRSRP
ncbi:MAG TPA: glycosyltransferase family 39 protein [Burkholderiaceae bacterium]|nr:glycosyltransferase family 39 protein [Burkholderiaceae bacterium]